MRVLSIPGYRNSCPNFRERINVKLNKISLSRLPSEYCLTYTRQNRNLNDISPVGHFHQWKSSSVLKRTVTV